MLALGWHSQVASLFWILRVGKLSESHSMAVCQRTLLHTKLHHTRPPPGPPYPSLSCKHQFPRCETLGLESGRVGFIVAPETIV